MRNPSIQSRMAVIEVGTCSSFSPLSFGGGGVEIRWPALEITDEREGEA